MKLQRTADYVLSDEKVTFNENRWTFVFSQTDTEACNALNTLLEEETDGFLYLTALLKLVDQYPQDADIACHVAGYYHKIKQETLSYTYTQSAVSLVLQAMPDHFDWQNVKIDYSDMDNRPFFRAYSFLAQHYYEFDLIDEAITICQRLISIHYNDDVGMRYLLVSCYQQQNNTKALNKLCKKYPEEDLIKNAESYIEAFA